MPFKTITIKKDVYEKLLKVKPKEESFSEFLDKEIAKRKPDIMKYAGAWSKLSENDLKKMEKTRKKFREGVNKSFKGRLEKIERMWSESSG